MSILTLRICIQSESLPQDYSAGHHGHGVPLCMQTYKHFFKACRIPGEDKDTLYINDAHTDYIVVACRNQFFLLRLKTEEMPDEEELVEQLRLIWYLSKEYETSSPSIGLMTTENRKQWASMRNNLIKKITNKQSLHYLETCLYVLCLDDSVSVKAATAKNQRRDSAVEMAKMEAAFMCSQLLHGGGSDYYTGNRYFDKFLQFVVGRDGICGIVCEHSASEGITVLRFMNEFLTFLNEKPIDCVVQRKDSLRGNLYTKNNNLLSSRSIVRLLWDLDETLLHCIQDATKRINKLTIAGQGPDNHLMALKELAKRSNLEIPLLFREKAYKEYLNFQLSTSQLPNDKGIIVGYGAVVPDGYGISYTPTEEQIMFCISSFYSSPETSSDFFASSLEGSLLQMRELCFKYQNNVQ
ncbi:choline O-acyltransferase-like protein [Leptotrombidium deliense]|uniref:Choline O-acetyltransferase n=1 Tax=Leptotrombidium deliense TaxID=299467 RepID=A0A443SE50_9ACAR|nr:choline O-acyltransferase-like protein [Leptotrombidium deliense]